jgi:apolipoprotein N-acyltransferase
VTFFFGKNFYLPVITGILLWVAFPGSGGLWPLVFVALIPFFFILHKSSLRATVLAGLVCGMVHYLTLLYWVVIVLAKYGGLAWYISLQ